MATTYTEQNLRKTARQARVDWVNMSCCLVCSSHEVRWDRWFSILVDGHNTCLVVRGKCTNDHAVTANCAI